MGHGWPWWSCDRSSVSSSTKKLDSGQISRYDHDILDQRGRMPPKSVVRAALVPKKCSVCHTCGSAELIESDRNVRSTCVQTVQCSCNGHCMSSVTTRVAASVAHSILHAYKYSWVCAKICCQNSFANVGFFVLVDGGGAKKGKHVYMKLKF